MIKRLFFLALFVFLTVPAHAQDFPKVEVFGGYSYGNFGSTNFSSNRTNLNGWNASLNVNLNHWFGVTTDFSGLYGNSSATQVILPIGVPACPVTGCSIRTSEADKYHNFLFGPQFSLRKKKLTPFLHVLFGGTRFSQSGTTTFNFSLPPSPLPPPTTFNFSRSTTNFAFAAGGGLDYNFSGKLAWRVQADYLQIGIPNRTLNNVRVSTGLVFHF